MSCLGTGQAGITSAAETGHFYALFQPPANLRISSVKINAGLRNFSFSFNAANMVSKSGDCKIEPWKQKTRDKICKRKFEKEISYMATLELVEKLRTHAEVSYDDAREALDACDDDLLDAIIYLERKGKIPKPEGTGAYTTEKQHTVKPVKPPKDDYRDKGESFGHLMRRFFKWFGGVVRKGNRNLFVIYQADGELASMPVTLLVILLLFCFPIVLPLMIAGLFFGFRYRFRGRELEGIGANRVMDGAASVAEDLKRSVKYNGREEKEHSAEND
jgi:NACalpha-BTF3-like transcription factor